MAKNRLEISRIGERQLRKLPRDVQRRVVKGILALADEPLPKGARKLAGYDDVFRLRVGRYRVLYSLSGRKLVVISLRSGGENEGRRLTGGSSTPRLAGRRRQASGRYT